MQTYRFKDARLNVAKYEKPLGKEVATRLSIDRTLANIIDKYGLHRAVFQGVNGNYLSTPVGYNDFVSNVFKLDVEAVSSVSLVLESFLSGTGLYLKSWSLRESNDGECSLRVSVCDGQYDVFNVMPCIVFSKDTFEVLNTEATRYFTIQLNTILAGVKSIIASMKTFMLPIDLLEISLFDTKFSEEFMHRGNKTCVYEGTGSFTNTTHVVNGLAVMTRDNGFHVSNRLDGKYAMVVVL